MEGGGSMNIRLCVYPTSLQPKLIAYTNEYKLRSSLANAIIVLAGNNIKSEEHLCYQITVGRTIRYLDYTHGRSIERLLDYITHRNELVSNHY